MVREIIEQIEQLYFTASARSDAPRSVLVEQALAHCLQELRAIVAHQARDRVRHSPVLRIV
jgi:hypothetical protein